MFHCQCSVTELATSTHLPLRSLADVCGIQSVIAGKDDYLPFLKPAVIRLWPIFNFLVVTTGQNSTILFWHKRNDEPRDVIQKICSWLLSKHACKMEPFFQRKAKTFFHKEWQRGLVSDEWSAAEDGLCCGPRGFPLKGSNLDVVRKVAHLGLLERPAARLDFFL